MKKHSNPNKILSYFFKATSTLALFVSPIYADNITEFDSVTTSQTTTITTSSPQSIQDSNQPSSNRTLYHYTCGGSPSKDGKPEQHEGWSRDQKWGKGEYARYQLTFDGYVDSNNQFFISHEDHDKWPKLSVQGIQDTDANTITNPRTKLRELDWNTKAINWNLKNSDGSYESYYTLTPLENDKNKWVYESDGNIKFVITIPVPTEERQKKGHKSQDSDRPNPASYIFVHIRHTCSDERCVDPKLTGKAKEEAINHKPHVEFTEKCRAHKKDPQ